MKKKKKHHAGQGEILNLHPVRQTSAIRSQEATSGKTKQNQVLQRWGIMTTSFFLLSLIRKSTVLHFPQTYIYVDINKILSQFQLPHHFTSAIGAKISLRFQIPIEKEKPTKFIAFKSCNTPAKQRKSLGRGRRRSTNAADAGRA
jgi:hypothetical protein